jgi:signal transduction histidine kinase
MEIPQTITVHPPQNDHTVYCDPEKMEIVFVNLFVNAIQAIDEKKGDIIIEINDDPLDDNVAMIKVRDTGCGMPPEIMGKIFDPLFTTKQVGTGLGLSSCKNIIEQHGGTISASSKLGDGSTLTIRLPTKPDLTAIPKQKTQNNALMHRT